MGDDLLIFHHYIMCGSVVESGTDKIIARHRFLVTHLISCVIPHMLKLRRILASKISWNNSKLEPGCVRLVVI